MRIDVWSDIACPWCYIGKRHLERALDGFAHAGDVEVVWHAFELDPGAPKVAPAGSNAERLANKYRTTPAQAHQMIERVIATGAKAGLDLRLHDAKHANTFDAHRLVAWAHAQGQQAAMQERLMRAYQAEAAALGDHDVLAALAADVGLPADDARAVLASDQFAADVRRDEAAARELGITGVPFFVLDGRFGVAGAQPIETLAAVLAKAWDQRESA